MAASSSPRRQIQALCDAWGTYVALPHARTHLKATEAICEDILDLPLTCFTTSDPTSNNAPRYYLLLGQLVLEAKALPLSATVLANTEGRITADGCNATAASSAGVLARVANTATWLIKGVCVAVASILEATTPSAHLPPRILAGEQLLGGSLGVTAGGVRDQLLQQLLDPGLHKAMAGVIVAFDRQAVALEGILQAGQQGGRALSSRSRNMLEAGITNVRQSQGRWLGAAAWLLHTSMRAAELAGVGNGAEGCQQRDGELGPGSSQQFLCTLEGSGLLEEACRLALSLQDRCGPAGEWPQSLGIALHRLATATRALAELAPTPPTQGDAAASAQRPAEAPAAAATARRMLQLLLQPDVQRLQRRLLRRWADLQLQPQEGQEKEQEQERPGSEAAAGGSAAGSSSPACKERRPSAAPAAAASATVPACGDSAGAAAAPAGMMEHSACGTGEQDRGSHRPWLRTWLAVSRWWEVPEEGSASAAAPGGGTDTAASSGGGGNASCPSVPPGEGPVGCSSSGTGCKGQDGDTVGPGAGGWYAGGSGGSGRSGTEDGETDAGRCGGGPSPDPSPALLCPPASLPEDLLLFLRAAQSAAEHMDCLDFARDIRTDASNAAELLRRIHDSRLCSCAPPLGVQQPSGSGAHRLACVEAAGRAVATWTTLAVKPNPGLELAVGQGQGPALGEQVGSGEASGGREGSPCGGASGEGAGTNGKEADKSSWLKDYGEQLRRLQAELRDTMMADEALAQVLNGAVGLAGVLAFYHGCRGEEQSAMPGALPQGGPPGPLPAVQPAATATTAPATGTATATDPCEPASIKPDVCSTTPPSSRSAAAVSFSTATPSFTSPSVIAPAAV